jgi:hypothetical protein
MAKKQVLMNELCNSAEIILNMPQYWSSMNSQCITQGSTPVYE